MDRKQKQGYSPEPDTNIANHGLNFKQSATFLDHKVSKYLTVCHESTADPCIGR